MKGVMSTHSTYAQMDNYFHEYRVEDLANYASEESYATPVHQVYHGLHLNRFPPWSIIRNLCFGDVVFLFHVVATGRQWWPHVVTMDAGKNCAIRPASLTHQGVA